MQPKVVVNNEVFSVAPTFYISDVAQIMDMPESRVKNWTIGRPLQIVPGRRAAGTGSRNLYGVHDLYRFGVAQWLSTDGFAPHAIQSILDALGVDFSAAVFAIVASSQSGQVPWKKRSKPNVRVIPQEKYEREGQRLIDGAMTSSLGCYLLNLGGITAAVDHLTQLFMRKHSAIWGSAKIPVPQPLSRQVPSAWEAAWILGSRKRKFRE